MEIKRYRHKTGTVGASTFTLTSTSMPRIWTTATPKIRASAESEYSTTVINKICKFFCEDKDAAPVFAAEFHVHKRPNYPEVLRRGARAQMERRTQVRGRFVSSVPSSGKQSGLSFVMKSGSRKTQDSDLTNSHALPTNDSLLRRAFSQSKVSSYPGLGNSKLPQCFIHVLRLIERRGTRDLVGPEVQFSRSRMFDDKHAACRFVHEKNMCQTVRTSSPCQSLLRISSDHFIRIPDGSINGAAVVAIEMAHTQSHWPEFPRNLLAIAHSPSSSASRSLTHSQSVQFHSGLSECLSARVIVGCIEVK